MNEKIAPIPKPQPDTMQAHVASEVRAQLARAQLSGNQAAKALGWTHPYIARRLRGDTPLDVNDLDALAQLLSVPVTAFFAVAPANEPRGHGNIANITGSYEHDNCKLLMAFPQVKPLRTRPASSRPFGDGHPSEFTSGTPRYVIPQTGDVHTDRAPVVTKLDTDTRGARW